jgi:hypothetical protein
MGILFESLQSFDEVGRCIFAEVSQAACRFTGDRFVFGIQQFTKDLRRPFCFGAAIANRRSDCLSSRGRLLRTLMSSGRIASPCLTIAGMARRSPLNMRSISASRPSGVWAATIVGAAKTMRVRFIKQMPH